MDNIKAHFFAGYLGQKVLISAMGSQIELTPHSLYEVVKYDSNDWCYLLLRSISDLTDEEMVNIAKLAYGTSWENKTTIASRVPNVENCHSDIISIEIQQFINLPPLPKYYKCCHIQIDTVDIDINLLRFLNDGKEQKDDIIGSLEQWAIQSYLRSIGVLLPFTYLDENKKPVTLQPGEIIAKGWVKYKTI